MKRQRVHTAACAVVIAFLLSLTCLAASYSDTAGHWGETYIEEWTGYGIIKGSDGKFRPNDPITRGEFAKVLAETMKLSKKADNRFSDLPQAAWYTDYVLKCVEAGIMLGDGGSDTIRPTDSITRQEAFVMFARAFGIEATAAPDMAAFADGAQIASWAAGYIKTMVDKGYIHGVTKDTMQPRANINRASVVTVLSNAVDSYIIEQGAAVTMQGESIVLVAADNVTLNGVTNGTVIVTGGAENATVNVKGSVEHLKVQANNVTVRIDGGSIVKLDFEGRKGVLDIVNSGKVLYIKGDYETVSTPITPDPGGVETPGGSEEGPGTENPGGEDHGTDTPGTENPGGNNPGGEDSGYTPGGGTGGKPIIDSGIPWTPLA